MTFDRAAEIARIEQELANLEARRTAMERAGRMLQVFFVLLLAGSAVATIASIIVGSAPAVLFSTTVMVVVAIVAFLPRNVRPIELGMQSIGLLGVERTPEFKAVEGMIAERTARLAALRRERT